MKETQYVVQKQAPGKAPWFMVSTDVLFGPVYWTPNLRQAHRGEQQQVQAICDLIKRADKDPSIGIVPIEPQAAPSAPALPFFATIMVQVNAIAQEAAADKNLELLPVPPLFIPYAEGEPLWHFRADWLFQAVAPGGARHQFQVRATAIEESGARYIELRVPYSSITRTVALEVYLRRWREKGEKAGHKWAGGHARSSFCSCPFCQDAQRQGLVPQPHGEQSEWCL